MRRCFVLLLFALTVALGACAGDRGESHDATSSTGNEIVVGIAQDLGASLDPHQMVAAGTAGLREVLFNVFEGLVKPNPDGELIPAVAERFTVDGAVYTFTLREGVRFHNGALVTVQDIVYSIERSADATSVSTFVSAFSVITRVEALDERTVQIEIAQPDLEFLAFLTIAIIPEGYDDQARNPIGTGPFRFVSHTPQESLVLERFDDYWGLVAYLDRVTFRIFGSGEALALAVQAGVVDVAAHMTADMIRRLPEGFRYVAGPMNLVQALWLNNAVPPLDDVRVRRALAWAIDTQEIIDMLFDGEGFPIGSAMPPSFTRYFDEALAHLWQTGDPAFDRDMAREILLDVANQNPAAAGFDLTITVPSNYTPHVLTAEILAEQLRAVGVNVTIDLVEWAWWLSEVNSGRNFQATVMGIAARDLTARSFMERWVSDNSRNFINFYHSDYDAMFARAQATTDEAEQIALYRDLQALLADEAASVFLQDLVNFVAINGRLTGWRFYSIYVMDLSTVRFVE